MTTDASSPRMAIVVWPDEVIALNAYSAHDRVSGMPQQLSSTPRTDLVETALGGEDGEVPVGPARVSPSRFELLPRWQLGGGTYRSYELRLIVTVG